MAQRLNLPDREGVFHFVTLNVRERKRPFVRPDLTLCALTTLRFECDRHPAQLVAYVVMPDHLHFILHLNDGRLTRFLARYKPNVTRNIDELLLLQERQNALGWLNAKGRRELWQDGKYSLPLYSSDWIREKITYIHENPVRAGLCQHPADYLWSSYNAYAGESIVPPVPVDLWQG